MAAKQLLLYGRIDSYEARDFNTAMQEIEEEDEILLRINTQGGSPEYGWGIISMFKDMPNVKKVKVDGQAHSMGAFILCYVEEAEALDVAEFLIHRAAYPAYFEESDLFNDAIKENLMRINKSLEKAFRAKVDVAMFEEIKGVKVKDIFAMDSRIDVYLDAEEAKKIGLISKIVPLTAAAAAEIGTFAKAASSEGRILVPENKAENTIIKPLNKNTMTVAELRATHPEVYAAIQTEAITAERDRVGSLMAFHDIDPETVGKAIKEGGALTATMAAEFSRKVIAKSALGTIEADSAKDLNPGEKKEAAGAAAAKEKEEKAVETFLEAAVNIAKGQIKA